MKSILVIQGGGRAKGMVLAGGCGDTNGRPQIDKTGHLQETYEFGKRLYPQRQSLSP